MGSLYHLNMRIISIKKLKDFWEKNPKAEKQLRAWYADAKQAHWKSPDIIKQIYRNASIVGNNRVVFNIHGNSYRLVVAINYFYSIVYVRFIGTHAEYDKIDVKKI